MISEPYCPIWLGSTSKNKYSICNVLDKDFLAKQKKQLNNNMAAKTSSEQMDTTGRKAKETEY